MANFRVLVLVGMVGVVGSLGCGRHIDSPGDGGGGGSAIESIEVKPPMQTVALTPLAAGFTATQGYAVIATYGDGTMADVTAQATWDSDDDNAISFAGTSTATVTAAGNYQITAMVGATAGSATLTATLAGTSLGSNFAPADQGKLDATPDSTIIPTIAYPLAGALFPVNVAPIEIHAQKTDATQTLARVTFTSGALLTYSFYAECAASPNPGTFANACIVPITGGFATQLAGVSETDDVHLTVRLAAADGSKLGESAPTTLAWAKTPLTGGIYYWTTAGTGDATFNTAIARYDFAGDTTAPSIYLSSADAPAVPAGQTQCVGCHAVSPNGANLAFSLGGSLTGYFSLYDVASVAPIASTNTAKFAGMTTFSPDGSRMVNMSYGTLTLRDSDATLDVDTTPLFTATVSEQMSHPTWSSSGNSFAFVSWIPSSADIAAQHITGDMVQGGQIWMTTATPAGPSGTPTLLVPRADGVTSYYPNISDDDQFVVFNQSSCAGPANTPGGWGAGPCDGYNDISATLMMVPSAGGTPVVLTNANGSSTPVTTNSWPRWSPDHGTFRGKNLYWVAFSSRRGYGLSLASGAGADTTKPQLWFAAVALDPIAGLTASDPSFAPVWLPGQDPDLSGPRGNHTPAWTSKILPIE